MSAGKKLLIAGALGGAAYWYYLKLEDERRLQQAHLNAQSLGRKVDNAASDTKAYVQNKYQESVDAAEKQKKALGDKLTQAQRNSEDKLNELSSSAQQQKDAFIKNVDDAVVTAGDKSKGWIDSTVGWVTGKK
ncbi:hypothetical protein B9G98_03813 [Wickerhamiella sorbophila]|uniref:Uncharacterized protein n=1 Tax=Wickerhamiella sorbophila TaxID=45607 RepID=A0A2T0FMG8_9ASCO|nr:hypothetical protein B9G98_03813 [Wickerhamiella sorbophila]PRT56193.1 hypothetical protein B9G98_03813 [Wickerhamiella sorbophila]